MTYRYPLLAAMITARPWNNIVDTDVASLVIPNSKEEKAKLKQYAAQYAVDIGRLLNTSAAPCFPLS